MGETTFAVTLNDLCCSNLKPFDNGSNDPFLKVNFDGVKFKTETLKHTCDPKWRKTKNFFWSTNVIHRLPVKNLKMECYDHNLASSNTHIGTATIDLFTLVTGPKHVTLTLFSRSAEKMGTVSFEAQISQVVTNFTCQLRYVCVCVCVV
jgi:Ca2+-dependent lipid-binding protein